MIIHISLDEVLTHPLDCFWLQTAVVLNWQTIHGYSNWIHSTKDLSEAKEMPKELKNLGQGLK